MHDKIDGYQYKDTYLYKTTLPDEEKKDVLKETNSGFSLAFRPITSTNIDNNDYDGEVYEKDGKYIYNFWRISDKELDPIFISVFRDTSKFGKRFVPELDCWSYVVKGFADNPFAASLKMRIFEELDNALTQHSRSP